MEFFGVRILGLSEAGLRKLALTLAVITLALLARSAFRLVAGFSFEHTSRRTLWARKGIRLTIGFVTALLLLSIWFDDPGRLASFMGLLAAGLAFAAQNLVLSIAGYFVIVFGKVFDFGHRIQLGGVRGDVLDIGLVKTTIMEMGVPAALFPDPHHWVAARQYTGRVVSVVNAEVFRNPVFNYTANFNLLWEELRIPVRYGTDLAVAERIVAEAARVNTQEQVALGKQQLETMRKLYLVEPPTSSPRFLSNSPTTGSSSPSVFSSRPMAFVASRTAFHGKSSPSSNVRRSPLLPRPWSSFIPSIRCRRTATARPLELRRTVRGHRVGHGVLRAALAAGNDRKGARRFEHDGVHSTHGSESSLANRGEHLVDGQPFAVKCVRQKFPAIIKKSGPRLHHSLYALGAHRRPRNDELQTNQQRECKDALHDRNVFGQNEGREGGAERHRNDEVERIHFRKRPLTGNPEN